MKYKISEPEKVDTPTGPVVGANVGKSVKYKINDTIHAGIIISSVDDSATLYVIPPPPGAIYLISGVRQRTEEGQWS